jgi:putative ABC transport system permease protein
MNLWNNLLLGVREILAHKFRSCLTMLGVILGVASLVSTYGLTAGVTAGSREFMAALGGIERVQLVGQEVPEEQQLMASSSPGRTVRDAEAIRDRADGVVAVTPVYEIPGFVSRGRETDRTIVFGVWPDYVQIESHVVEHGRNLCQLDLDLANRVCVIGRKTVEELWPDRPNSIPLGEQIFINARPFTVVGVFERYQSEEDKRRIRLGLPPRSSSRSSGRGFDPYRTKNQTVIIPFTAAYHEFKSANLVGKDDQGPILKIDALSFRVVSLAELQSTIERVSTVLREVRRGVEDYTFQTRQDWADRMAQQERNLQMSGGLIAGISLVIGGIGITNIMLASITERIREIGVRRAVGARGRHIFVQILVESAVIGVVGGVLGLLVSPGILWLLQKISPEAAPPVVEPSAAIVSFTFAVLISVASGFYPALRASRIEPIEALRYG